MKLKNKVALITGSSRGIGKAIALEFAKEGAALVINYLHSKKEAEEVASKAKELGVPAIVVKADVSNPNEVALMTKKALKEFGKIDVLVNNAGVANVIPLEKLSKTDWRKILDINLIGTFLCSQQVAQSMLKRKSGTIINISSIVGLNYCTSQKRMDYSASKAGVINLTKSLAKQLAPYIRVNSVAPGYTLTDFHKDMTEEKKRQVIEKIPLRRIGEPIDIARVVLFLASDSASYITGEVLVVDGGYSLL